MIAQKFTWNTLAVLFLTFGSLATLAVPSVASGQAEREDYETGPEPRRISFDGGKGTLWMSPHTQARRVATSVVLREGVALWAHEDADATLTVGDRDIMVKHGGVVGLRSESGGIIDVYAGSGNVSIGNKEGPSGFGVRYEGSEEKEVPPLDFAYTLDAYDPLETEGNFGQGFLGILQVGVPGQSKPIEVDPTSIDLRVTLSGVVATTTAKLSFELAQKLPCCNAHIGVAQLMLPPNTLVRDLTATLGGVTVQSEVVSNSSDNSRKMLADEFDRDDFGAGRVERFNLGLYPLKEDSHVEVEVTWVSLLELDRDALVYQIPALGDLQGRHVGQLSLTVDSTARVLPEVTGNVALAKVGETWTWSESDRALEPGLVLRVPRDGQHTWAGRTDSVDGIFFALELPFEVAQKDAPLDLVILVDDSSSVRGSQRKLANSVAMMLATSLDARRDTLSIARISDKATLLVAAQSKPDLATLDAIEKQLATPSAGGPTDLSEALDLAAALTATKRPEALLQVVYIGDGEPTAGADADAFTALSELTEVGAAALIVEVNGAGRSEYLAEFRTQWTVPTLFASTSASGPVVAARALAHFGTLLRPIGVVDVKANEVLTRNWWNVEPSWSGGSALLLGQFQSQGALFDLPGQFELCLSAPGMSCDAPQLVDLTKATDSRALGYFAVAARMLAAKGVPLYQVDETNDLGVLDNRSIRVLPALTSAFVLAKLEHPAETAWIDNNLDAQPGRAVPLRAAPIPVPDPSDPSGDSTGASSHPLERDPFLKVSPRKQLPLPRIDEVVSGIRGGNTPAYAYTNPTLQPGTVQYALEYQLNYTVDRALVVAREAVLAQYAADPTKAQDFIRAWHELSLKSTSQLYAVQNQMYNNNMLDDGTLASQDINIIDPYYGPEAKKGAITYFMDTKHWKRAEPHLREGHRNTPNDHYYTENLIRLLKATGRTDEVAALEIEDLQRELLNNPDDIDVVDRLLRQLVKAGRIDAANKALAKWGEEGGASPTYFGLQARLALLSGNRSKAAELLSKGLEQFPRSRRLNGLALDGLIEDGQSANAIQFAEQWSEQDPRNAYLAQLIGDLYTRAGDHEGALAAYYGLLELVPDMAVGHIKVGDALNALGRPKDASKSFERALALNPGNFATTLRILEAAAGSGDRKRATEAYDNIRYQNSTESWEAVRARDESFFQLLCKWHADAVYKGDDPAITEIEATMGTMSVDAGIYPNAQRYALRMAFVPENAENGLLINFQVSEPGGTIVSTISPYGSPLGSQLYTLAGKSGPSPRVYILPVAEPGDFRVEITHEGPSNAGPARGKLYLFKTPKPFAEYWEQHNVLIPRVGESFDLTFTIDQLPTGDLTIPPKGTP